jgi:hypothetical protein
MSFIIWYKVRIEETAGGAGGLLAAVASLIGAGLPIQASNDVFSGQYILDADVTLTMPSGAVAQQFEVTLFNLPGEALDLLKSKHLDAVKSGRPLRAHIHLGYFEDGPLFTAPDPAMVGAITAVRTSVDAQGTLVTELRGQELGGYRLRTHRFSMSRKGTVQADQIVSGLAADTETEVAPGSTLNRSFRDFTLQASNGLAALEQVARRCQVPLVVRDNKILLASAVGADRGPSLSAEKNIVKMDRAEYSEEIPDPSLDNAHARRRTEPRTSLSLTVLGEPRLRVGQTLDVDVADKPAGTLRVHSLVHRFSTRAGYTCDVTLLRADAGKLAVQADGVHGVVDRIRDLAEELHDQRTSVDVGQVKSYDAGKGQKHVATLNYGQQADETVVNPSVQTRVEQATPQLHSKPIASPFAWHRCGLIVPVYPGMRAVLAHNRGLVNDAIVHGFLWAETPRDEPPQNEPGDYWLCLPTELGADDRPTGKGVNDLIDKSGHRIIQAKGLHIVVGGDKLPSVGSRPTPPADDTIVLEHQSGTTITIASDGAVEIKTTGKDLSLTNGSVRVNLSGSSVQVS